MKRINLIKMGKLETIEEDIKSISQREDAFEDSLYNLGVYYPKIHQKCDEKESERIYTMGTITRILHNGKYYARAHTQKYVDVRPFRTVIEVQSILMSIVMVGAYKEIHLGIPVEGLDIEDPCQLSEADRLIQLINERKL